MLVTCLLSIHPHAKVIARDNCITEQTSPGLLILIPAVSPSCWVTYYVSCSVFRIKPNLNLLCVISFFPVRNDHQVVAATSRHLSTSCTNSMNSQKISQNIIPFTISRSVGHTCPCTAPARERLVHPNLMSHWSWKWRSSISNRYSSSTALLMSFWIVRCKDSCLVDYKMSQYLVD